MALIAPSLFAHVKLTLFDLITASIMAYTLRIRGLGVARKPYIDVLILATRNRNISKVLELNKVEDADKLILIAVCSSNTDLLSVEKKLEAIGATIDLGECGATLSLEPLSTSEIAVFALDSKVFGGPTRWVEG